jgi:hypothetical protein
MRDARNLQKINLKIDEELCTIDSVWVTENGELYVKVNQKDMTVNYQAEKIVSMIMMENEMKLQC